MMGKNPAFQFYPSDWTRDLDDQGLDIEGAWIRIICRLWWADEKGKATKSLREWSNILRTHPNKTGVILKTLLTKKICDGCFMDNQNITIISRRMVSDWKISQIRKAVGKLGGNPNLKKRDVVLLNQTDNQKSTPSSSSSTSKNINKGNGLFKPPKIEEVREYCRLRQNSVDPGKWHDYYSSNGWKVGKNQMKDWQAAVRTWEKSEFNAPKKESW
jgi:hypothetical protein